MTRWTAQDVTRVTLKRQLAKPAKYRNQKTTLDGITFDSAKEAKRYTELKMLEKAGKITNLMLQPEYPLCVRLRGGADEIIGNYVADFRYCDSTTSAIVVEDVKGLKTPMYRWKKKHFEAQYGIRIRES